MRVVIVTEGGGNIGYGHLSRCSALYAAFKEKGINPLFIVNADRNARYLLNDMDHEIFDWLRKRQRLLSCIRGSDIVVLDSYRADEGIYRDVSRLAKRALYFDDTKRIKYPKGFVLNASASAKDLGYDNEHNTYLLGTKYLPLRKEFWGNPRRNIKDRITRIFISFGAGDVANMNSKILQILMREYPDCHKRVIIAEGSQAVKQIRKLSDKKIKISCSPETKDIRKEMLLADLAVSAGGQTLFELARLGVPTIAIGVADNQFNNLRGFVDSGFIIYAGSAKDSRTLDAFKKIMRIVQNKELRRSMSRHGMSLVDGDGARRVCTKLIN